MFLFAPSSTLAVKSPSPAKQVTQSTKKKANKVKHKTKKAGFFKRLFAKWSKKKQSKKHKKAKRKRPEQKKNSQWLYHSKKVFLGSLIVYLTTFFFVIMSFNQPQTFAGMVGSSEFLRVLWLGSMILGIVALLSILLFELVRLF